MNWIVLMAWMSASLVLGQGVDDAYKGIREFGVSVVMNIVFLIVLWYGAAKILPAELERRQKSFDMALSQMRTDHTSMVAQMREDQREDNQRSQEIINLQRTEFISALQSNQLAHKEEIKELIASQKENMTVQKEAISRIERHLEALTAEFKASRLNNKG